MREGSSIVLATLGERQLAYVADEDDEVLRTLDLAQGMEVAVTPLEGRPSQLLVARGGRIIVALRDRSTVDVYGSTTDPTAPLEHVARAQTATEPVALAVTPDGQSLLVACAWAHTIDAFDLQSFERTFSVQVPREPRSVVVSGDGSKAFVSHAAAGVVSIVGLGEKPGSPRSATFAPQVRSLDLGMPGWTETRSELVCMIDFDVPRLKRIRFPKRVSRQGFTLARVLDDKSKSERIIAPHVLVATGDPLVRSSGYGGGGVEDEKVDTPAELFDIDVLDAANGTRVTGSAQNVRARMRVGVDACHLPRASAVDARRGHVLVSCLGTDTVAEYDARTNVPTDRLERRWKVPAGPTGIAVDPDGDRALVFSQFERVVSVIPLSEPAQGAKAGPSEPPRTIGLGPASHAATAEALLGRRLFHTSLDARIAADGRACASCHPEGRDDGLVWPTPNGPRQTLLLAGRVRHAPPFGWLGGGRSLVEHIERTLKKLHGKGLTRRDEDELAAYVLAMPPPPDLDRPLTEQESTGRSIFTSTKTECSSCHVERTSLTDGMTHDVGSASPADLDRAFLTPSLRFVGGSSPYFHDGRYATLTELLQGSRHGKMGSTAELSDDDMNALEAYLRTL